MFLIAARSQLLKPGPSRLPLPSLPKWFQAWANESVENHSPTVLGLCTAATWSGRVAPRPRPTFFPFGSHGSRACVTENDEPEMNCVMPETSQPPAKCPAKPCCPLENGRSYT